MVIPDGFKTVIGDKFFDKSLKLYASSIGKDAHNTSYLIKGALTSTIACNAFYDQLERIKTDYGIDEDVAVTFTTHIAVNKGQLCEFDGRDLIIAESIKRDSHYFLIAKSCSLR